MSENKIPSSCEECCEQLGYWGPVYAVLDDAGEAESYVCAACADIYEDDGAAVEQVA